MNKDGAKYLIMLKGNYFSFFPEQSWTITNLRINVGISRNALKKKLKKCPAWEFNAGDLCWFINGTKCNGEAHNSWEDKMEECRACKVFNNFFEAEKGI